MSAKSKNGFGISRALGPLDGLLSVVVWHFVAGAMITMLILLALGLGGCSSAPQLPGPPEPVDAGQDAADVPECVVFELWQHTGRPCDPTFAEPCPPSNNPCMHSLCTNDGICVLGVPGEGQPGVCGAGMWCRFVGAEVLGCCPEPPACIYDLSYNCAINGGFCPYASNPNCSLDGECCQ